MAEAVFHIGAPVRCKDGPCGRLQRVVVDPTTKRITDLIVAKGFLLTTDRVLPVHTVEEASDEGITVSMGKKDLENCPEFVDVAFEPAPSELDSEIDESTEVLVWAAPDDPYYLLPAVPLIRRHVHRGLAPEEVAIGRGTPVYNVEDQIGEVDHVLVNPETEEITYVVVDPGPTSHSLVVPVSMVQTVAEEGVHLEVTDQELRQLYRYSCPSDDELLANLRDSLGAIASGLRDIGLTVERGVVRMAGVVPDTEAKRRAEAVARSARGVVHVENALGTDAAIAARVTVALMTDSRTELSSIDVVSEGGVVTLTGDVDSAAIREAAEEIARSQPNVVTVLNDLGIRPDEYALTLKLRGISRVPSWGEDQAAHFLG